MVETTKNSKSKLFNSLFSAADSLRGKMDANEYKNYLLGLIFYKYLSDKLLYQAVEEYSWGEDSDVSLEEAQTIYTENYQDLKDELKGSLRYTIEPEHTFTYLMQEIDGTARTKDGNVKTFQNSDLGDAFNDIESTGKEFEGLFDDVDLYSRRLGSNAQKQTDTIMDVMKALRDIQLVNRDKDSKSDSLGDAYEYLIGEFASESGKKAGEFYTPQEVSKILTRLTLAGEEKPSELTVYDPAMGSGSLLLNFRDLVKNPNRIVYYGQEINVSTYNLARMNMILHGVSPENQHLRLGDTLDADWPPIGETMFDAVVMNPPYSLKWSADKGFLDDPRFSKYGVLPPKSKADYAFLLHGFYHLKNTGTMAIVLPHGVLFRGSGEGKIRQKLLEDGSIDAVIGLPPNIFVNTPIPTTIVVLKKNKTDRSVFFIDASREFEKQKKQNKLRKEDIDKVISTYEKREDVERYAHLADYKEIKENDFNLNITRYIDSYVPEPPVDLEKVAANLTETQAQIDENEKKLVGMLKELTSDDEKIMTGLNDIIKFFESNTEDK
ncbi:type I restriction-modification system subunit M [Lactobacillus sp.]|uniref:type I restriction-modification system subunit M n=1 Tax=Lactobacillus sp. TaxID=1591 RepID=UPI00198B5A79|nr:type I restriction-modification system subunit M [Lactobacillus sp.]MBD5429049.1 type I restriction-modification system subunit M [Lactobacillus sp.]MBD5430249.1 type I restriction-modification system subunit M [Lactobacillus sp.]